MEILFPLAKMARDFAARAYALARDRRIAYRAAYYNTGSSSPWGLGYYEAHVQYMTAQLRSPEVAACFAGAGKAALPPAYGRALDERCVEVPWALARIDEAKHILDAGSTLNHAHIVSLPVWENKKLHICTLAPEGFCAWQRGISYMYADFRDLPYRDESFDLVIALSSLEHVGMNNFTFSKNKKHIEQRTDDVLLALKELKRTLQPGARLLFSVPFGVYENHGTFQQFDSRLLDECRESFQPTACREDFYLYSQTGWQKASREDCTTARYAKTRFAPNGHAGSDNAAAARAVACCEWKK